MVLAGSVSSEGSRGDPVPCLSQLLEGAACISWLAAPSSHHSNLLFPSSHLFVLTLLPPSSEDPLFNNICKVILSHKVTESQAREIRTWVSLGSHTARRWPQWGWGGKCSSDKWDLGQKSSSPCQSSQVTTSLVFGSTVPS